MDRDQVVTLLTETEDETLTDESFDKVKSSLRALDVEDVYGLLKELADPESDLGQKEVTQNFMLRLAEDDEFYNWVCAHITATTTANTDTEEDD